jgi:hypothetical protein
VLRQDLPARARIQGKQSAAACQRIQVFANHRGIENRRSVVEDKGRNLAQRIVRLCIGSVRLPGNDFGVDQIKLVREAKLDGSRAHLAGERRLGRVHQLHGGVTSNGWVRTPFLACKFREPCFHRIQDVSEVGTKSPMLQHGNDLRRT